MATRERNYPIKKLPPGNFLTDTLEGLEYEPARRNPLLGKVIKGPTENACWIWTGAIGDDGYGRFWTQTPGSGQRMLRAHRAAAEIIYGLEEITGRLVTHLCDNPLCVRAELDGAGHLFIGTHAENMAEREHRGRGNLHNPLWRHQGRAARAAAARLLRAHTIQNGYGQRQVDELIRGIVMPGQTPLF